MITSFLERWMLAKDNLRVEILRDGDTLEWVETTNDGRTTGNGGSAYAITMPTTVLDVIRAHTAEGYELVAHEQYDGEQLAKYLESADEAETLRRQLEAAEAAPCEHDGPAFDALEKLHARIHRDFNFDAGECAPPTEDEPALRMMDDLVTYATELYMPLADATVGAPAAVADEPFGIRIGPDGPIVTGQSREVSAPQWLAEGGD
jgi:hypothetical protein